MAHLEEGLKVRKEGIKVEWGGKSMEKLRTAVCAFFLLNPILIFIQSQNSFYRKRPVKIS